jgi:hypothetical protein
MPSNELVFFSEPDHPPSLIGVEVSSSNGDWRACRLPPAGTISRKLTTENPRGERGVFWSSRASDAGAHAGT